MLLVFSVKCQIFAIITNLSNDPLATENCSNSKSMEHIGNRLLPWLVELLGLKY